MNALVLALDPSPALRADPPPAGEGEGIDDITIAWPSYTTLIEEKIVTAPACGLDIEAAELHPYLKPHARDLTAWALRGGRRGIFAAFGLAKTSMQLEWARQIALRTGAPTLGVLPLGVRHGFFDEAAKLGMAVKFIRAVDEMEGGVDCYLTNYESVRDGKLDPARFGAAHLDEASVLRSYGSKTYQEFLPLFDRVALKLVATATPSPNRFKELIHYAGFLGIMDTGQALTRFFQRNSEKAGDLTLYPHKEDEFWLWVHSWAAFVQRPSDLGYSDEGYELPPLNVVWHEVPAEHARAKPEPDGQGVMFRDAAAGVSQAAAAKRDSLPARIARMREIIAGSAGVSPAAAGTAAVPGPQDPARHLLIWHDLEVERRAIEEAVPGVVTIHGGEPIELREERLHAFERGEIAKFATKPILSGSGSNFQYHCHEAIFLGIGFKFNDFIQAIYRLQRFGQRHPVTVHLIYAEDERSVRAVLEEKWRQDGELRARMGEIIRKYGLSAVGGKEALKRTIGVVRREVTSETLWTAGVSPVTDEPKTRAGGTPAVPLWRVVNNDAVDEARRMAAGSVDLIVSSIPFGTQYEYAESFNDFGHNQDSAAFWRQMDHLTPQLLRILAPGRLACIHVKDRVRFGGVTGAGLPTIEPFHAEAIFHYRAHGFDYMGMVTIVTDVVRENNQTYRLGWSECCKDGSRMGVGMPEYLLLFHKPQSDRSRGYADVRIAKDKASYSRARWQIDAHAMWRSSGNRLLTRAEWEGLTAADHARLFAKLSAERIYDYAEHVAIGEVLERAGTLPATYMAIMPGAHADGPRADDVWTDVVRMRTLNAVQAAQGREKHICPLQFDIVDRCIERWSNPGEVVFDPFCGLGTVPVRAILKGRRGAGSELNPQTFADSLVHLAAAEERQAMPALFDLEDEE